jgi:hypothetical protein
MAPLVGPGRWRSTLPSWLHPTRCALSLCLLASLLHGLSAVRVLVMGWQQAMSNLQRTRVCGLGVVAVVSACGMLYLVQCCKLGSISVPTLRIQHCDACYPAVYCCMPVVILWCAL